MRRPNEFMVTTRGDVRQGEFGTPSASSIEEFAQIVMDPRNRGAANVYGVNQNSPNGLIGVRDDPERNVWRRTNDNFVRLPGRVGIGLFDVDDQSERGIAPCRSEEEADARVLRGAPWMEPVRRFWLRSASSNIFFPDGMLASTKDGWRCWFFLSDSSQMLRVTEEAMAGAFRAGDGAVWVNDGALRPSRLWRCLIDRSVAVDCQPDFAYGATLHSGMTQVREPVWFGREPMLQTATVPDTGGLKAFQASPEGAALYAAAEPAWLAARAAKQGEWIEKQATRGISPEAARQQYDATDAELPDAWPIYLDRNTAVTVGDILANPKNFNHVNCCDPYEPSYRNFAHTAYICIHQERPRISTFAHGGGENRWIDLRAWTGPELAARAGLTPLTDEAKSELVARGVSLTPLPKTVTTKPAGEAATADTDDAFGMYNPVGPFVATDFPVCNPKTNVATTNALINVKHVFQSAQIEFSYDKFTYTAFARRNGHKIKLTEGSYLRFWSMVQMSGLRTTPTMVANAIDAICQENAFDSAIDMISALPKWDGTVRAETFFISQYGAADTPYTRGVTRLFFAALIRRALGKASKFDYLVIVKGPQDIGKSTGLKILIGDEYYQESLLISDDTKVFMERTEGKLIAELGELAGMKKADRDHVKIFISKTSDSARMSYGRKNQTRERRCTLYGTSNPEGNVANLREEDRRFLFIIVYNHFKPEWIAANRLQILAEAVAIEASYSPHLVLPDDLKGEAAGIRATMVVQDPTELSLRKMFDGIESGRIEQNEVWALLGFKDQGAIGEHCAKHGGITGIMKALGWESSKITKGDVRRWCFSKGDSKEWLNISWPTGFGRTVADISVKVTEAEKQADAADAERNKIMQVMVGAAGTNVSQLSDATAQKPQLPASVH